MDKHTSDAFLGIRDTCPHYTGFRESMEEDQCAHEENTRASGWCAEDVCPLLRGDRK